MRYPSNPPIHRIALVDTELQKINRIVIEFFPLDDKLI